MIVKKSASPSPFANSSLTSHSWRKGHVHVLQGTDALYIAVDVSCVNVA